MTDQALVNEKSVERCSVEAGEEHIYVNNQVVFALFQLERQVLVIILELFRSVVEICTNTEL